MKNLQRATLVWMMVAACLFAWHSAALAANGSIGWAPADIAKKSDDTLYQIRCAYFVYYEVPTDPASQEYQQWPVKTSAGTLVAYQVLAAPNTESVETRKKVGGTWVHDQWHDDFTAQMAADMDRFWEDMYSDLGMDLGSHISSANPRYNCAAYVVNKTAYLVDNLAPWVDDDWTSASLNDADRAAITDSSHTANIGQWNHLSKFNYTYGGGCDPSTYDFTGKHGTYGTYMTDLSVTKAMWGDEVRYCEPNP